MSNCHPCRRFFECADTRVRGYRVMIFVDEPNEPAHVHVFKDAAVAKYRLDSLGLVVNRGHRPHDLAEIKSILSEHQSELIATYEKIHGHR